MAIFTRNELLKIVEPSIVDEDGYVPPRDMTLSKQAVIELRDFLNGLNL